jgi:sporulation protein YlmC with PRC-barrel domain
MKRHYPFQPFRLATLALSISTLPALGQDAASAQTESPTSAQSEREASKDELRVAPEEAKQEVTDANKASKIIGMAVKNKENENVGKVHDLVIDPQSGKIAYAVLSSGGVMGMGDKLIAVPFESLTPQQGEKGFLINAQKERLREAPGFTEKNWPKLDAAQDSTIGLSPTGRPSSKSGRADYDASASATSSSSSPSSSSTSSGASPSASQSSSSSADTSDSAPTPGSSEPGSSSPATTTEPLSSPRSSSEPTTQP